MPTDTNLKIDFWSLSLSSAWVGSCLDFYCQNAPSFIPYERYLFIDRSKLWFILVSSMTLQLLSISLQKLLECSLAESPKQISKSQSYAISTISNLNYLCTHISSLYPYLYLHLYLYPYLFKYLYFILFNLKLN